MRLVALELDQFRKFARPVRVEGFASGLNIVVGPNELGKSTLLAALRAVLFARHRANTEDVRSLQPRDHRTAPRVALDVELDGGRHRIEKRFLMRPFARLTLPDGRRIEGDAAEDELLDLLGAGRAGGRSARDAMGVFGVIWAHQGESLSAPDADGSARQSLQACLEAEVGELLGGRESREVRARIEADLFALVTPQQERPTGRYRQVEEELGGLDGRIADIERKRDALAREIEELEAARAEHARLVAEDAVADEPARLDALRATRDRLLRRDEGARALEEGVKRAELELARIEDEVRRRHELREALAAARDAEAEAGADHDAATADLTAGQATLIEAERVLAELEAERSTAQHRLDGLRALEEAVRTRDRARGALEATAAEVSVEIESAARERVRIDGRPVAPDEPPRRASEVVEVAIEGVGRIVVRPSGREHEQLRREIAATERRIETLGRELARPPTSTPPARAQLELTFDAQAAAGSEIDALRLEVEGCAQFAKQLDDRIADARSGVEAERERRRGAEVARDRAATRLEAATAERQRLENRLAEAEETASDDELARAQQEKRDALAATVAEAEAARAGPDAGSLEDVDAEIRGLETTIETRRGRLRDLAARIDRLIDRIELGAGEGPDEQLNEALRRRDELERERARYRREVETLRLLRRALVDAEAEARERYLEPLVRRIEPHLERLFPRAAVRIDESYRITAIERTESGHEPIEQLSHGTREQLAVLVRLAFAEMLADRGRPALVVLDDALVFSDDTRLARMFEILEAAAAKVQVLILTCRERAFEALPATRLRLTEVPSEAAVQA